MKKLVLFATAWIVCSLLSISFAQDAKVPYPSNISNLHAYLELKPWQVEEVSRINDYFIEQQRNSFSKDTERYAEQMEETLYGNLKLMKGVLSKEQYRKYVTLINITHNNNNHLNRSLQFTDIYLAEKNSK